jgi:Uma2 family endonuclease
MTPWMKQVISLPHQKLVIEILSPGDQNERRDRDLKRRLYSAHGVREYWIVSRHFYRDFPTASIDYSQSSDQQQFQIQRFCLQRLVVDRFFHSPTLKSISWLIAKTR